MLGIIATILTVGNLIPQIMRIYNQKNADNLSWISLFVLFIGVICWLLYGIQLHDNIIIFANAISLALQSVLIGLKAFYTESAPTGGCRPL